MEQDNNNLNVDGLMCVIKEDYAAKASNNKWILGLIVLLIAVNLIDSLLNFSTIIDFIKSMFDPSLLVLLLLVVIIKNIYWFRKISESKTPEELLAGYRKNMKLDKIMLCVFVPLYILLFYIRHGFDGVFWIVLVFCCILFYFYFFGKAFKDKNIEELSGHVEQDDGDSAPNV